MLVTLSVTIVIAWATGGQTTRRIDFPDNYGRWDTCQEAVREVDSIDIPGVRVSGQCFMSL